MSELSSRKRYFTRSRYVNYVNKYVFETILLSSKEVYRFAFNCLQLDYSKQLVLFIQIDVSIFAYVVMYYLMIARGRLMLSDICVKGGEGERVGAQFL